jgi:hypothetical protein
MKRKRERVRVRVGEWYSEGRGQRELMTFFFMQSLAVMKLHPRML